MLVDRKGKDRGRLTVRGTIVRKIGLAGDALSSFQGNINIFKKGVINTQGVFQFSDIFDGVTFAIVGGTSKYKKAHGTVTAIRLDLTIRRSSPSGSRRRSIITGDLMTKSW